MCLTYYWALAMTVQGPEESQQKSKYLVLPKHPFRTTGCLEELIWMALWTKSDHQQVLNRRRACQIILFYWATNKKQQGYCIHIKSCTFKSDWTVTIWQQHHIKVFLCISILPQTNFMTRSFCTSLTASWFRESGRIHLARLLRLMSYPNTVLPRLLSTV